jgi:hypothetical protein
VCVCVEDTEGYGAHRGTHLTLTHPTQSSELTTALARDGGDLFATTRLATLGGGGRAQLNQACCRVRDTEKFVMVQFSSSGQSRPVADTV